MGIITQFPHGLSFAYDAFPTLFIKVVGLYEGEGDVPVETCIMDKVDLT